MFGTVAAGKSIDRYGPRFLKYSMYAHLSVPRKVLSRVAFKILGKMFRHCEIRDPAEFILISVEISICQSVSYLFSYPYIHIRLNTCFDFNINPATDFNDHSHISSPISILILLLILMPIPALIPASILISTKILIPA